MIFSNFKIKPKTTRKNIKMKIKINEFISIQTAWYSKPVYTRNRYLPRS